MNVFKKELLALSATLLLGLSAAAQNKRFEHNFYVGLGYATEFANEEAPIAFHVAYGLNCYLSPHWSVMPGVGYREKVWIGDATATTAHSSTSRFSSSIISPIHVRVDWW